ncbi:MAG: hypothetical protein ABSC51_06115 [Gaiellaceae bacterium]
MASDLDQQLTQLDELLGLLDADALKGAQETLEFHIAELNERLEMTRQALGRAQAQRRRLARARLLLEESGQEHNGNGEAALHRVPSEEPAQEQDSTGDPALQVVSVPAEPIDQKELATATAPFIADRRQTVDRRTNGDRRQSEDRRKGQRLPPAS